MYKNYNMSQLSLPLTTEITFPEGDTVHLVNDLVEQIPDVVFDDFKHHRGAPSHNPRMMLKILLYAYTNSIFSGRKIEFALKDSLRFMWLAQEQQPSYRTINRFRSNPLTNKLIKECFVVFRSFLVSQNLIEEDAIYIDGTKIEANANKYTFVWRANTERYSESNTKKSVEVYNQLMQDEIIPELERESQDELTLDELKDIEQKLETKIEDLNYDIDKQDNVETRKLLRSKRKSLKYYKKTISECHDKKEKYNEQFDILGDRRSYSKTDHDATFMRLKDDHMQNGQLKAAYNIQAATYNQFVLAYGIFQNPGDTRTLGDFLKIIEEMNGDIPEYIVADAGYGSESNYEMIMDEFERTPLIPYNMVLKEQKKKYKENIFNSANWKYDEINDQYICPNNKILFFNGYRYRTDKYGFVRDFKEYLSYDCVDCPLRQECMNPKARQNTQKKIRKNLKWEYFKNNTKKLLSDPETSKIYSQRKNDVETFFGNLKANLSFTRMSLRGKEKVETEIGIAFMAVNIKKLSTLRVDKFYLKLKQEDFSFFIMKIFLFSVLRHINVPAP
ncbi:IS1182 family transposase, partial [Staphylococcus pseudintermedius]